VVRIEHRIFDFKIFFSNRGHERVHEVGRQPGRPARVACRAWYVTRLEPRCATMPTPYQFSPLTRVTELDQDAQPGYYPFRIDTDGQRPLLLAAASREDAADWMNAVHHEIGRLINSVLAEYDVKGYRQYTPLAQGCARGEFPLPWPGPAAARNSAPALLLPRL